MLPSPLNEPLCNFFLQQPKQQKQISLPNYILFRRILKSTPSPPLHMGRRLDTRCQDTGSLGLKHLPQIVLALAGLVGLPRR